jgi:S-DNA-T family DNA segregation ATPase FtsK/SpoIIIE
MMPLADLPHCGAVVSRDQVDRTDRLLTVLLNEIARRQVLLAQHGYGSLAEQRAAAPVEERLPYLVFLLDRWEGFMASFDELDGGRLTQNVLRILREARASGCARSSPGDRSALLGRLPDHRSKDKLVLRMGDRNDYGLAGLQTKKMPDSMPPGPGVPQRLDAGDTARPARPRPVRARRRSKALAGSPPPRANGTPTCRAASGRPGSTCCPRGSRSRRCWRCRRRSAGDADVGAGRRRRRRAGADRRRPSTTTGPGFVIGGPARSGRSTALLTVAGSLLEGGSELVVVTRGRRRCGSWPAHPACSAC